MPVRRRFPAAVLTLTATGLAVGLTGAPAAAHGSMQNPLSRVEGCYLEGPSTRSRRPARRPWPPAAPRRCTTG
ncbi:hypothetical protein ACFQ0M_19345 [Kitasatospora aburaviensis]